MAEPHRTRNRRSAALLGLARLLGDVWNAAGERHLGLIAAGVAFFSLFATFPGVAALVALWGTFSDPAQIDAQVGVLREFLPAEAYSLLDSQIDRLVSDAHQGAWGWAAVLSLLVTLWSARLGVGALIQGLNAAHMVPNRGGVWHVATALVLTLALIGVAIVALASVIVLPLLLALMPMGGLAERALRIANWVVVPGVVLGAVALVYRFGPNKRPRSRWLSPGLWLAVALWTVASVAFSRFLAGFGDYNAVYGSLGAVVALLMWFYLSAYAVLLGAALNAEVEGRAQRRHQAEAGATPERGTGA